MSYGGHDLKPNQEQMILTQDTMEELLMNAPKWPKMDMRAMETPTAMRTIAILDKPFPVKVPICA